MENKKIRIGILGIGGIGGFVGGLLAKHYHNSPKAEVIFICRGKTLEAIRQNGLQLKGKSGNYTAFPALASDNPVETGLLDVLIIATKAYSLAAVLRDYGTVIGENTIILPLQNSVIAGEEIRKHSPGKGKVLEGCIYVASNVVAPGVIQHLGGPGKIFFGADETEPYLWLEKLLQDAGVQANLVPGIQEVLWTKFIFVAPVAAVTTARNLTFGELNADNRAKNQLRKLMEEINLLAKAKGVFLKGSIIEDSINLIEQFPSGTKSSLQLDIEKGAPAELGALVEYVLSESEKFGLNPAQYQEVYRQIAARMAAQSSPAPSTTGM